MLLAVILGIFIYKIYGHYFGGVVFSSSFAGDSGGDDGTKLHADAGYQQQYRDLLGMVGALSIVRYRTAIKDPMDLFVSVLVYFCGNHAGSRTVCAGDCTMLIMVAVVHLFYNRRKKERFLYW
mgnify:CR=1 FL=1